MKLWLDSTRFRGGSRGAIPVKSVFSKKSICIKFRQQTQLAEASSWFCTILTLFFFSLLAQNRYQWYSYDTFLFSYVGTYSHPLFEIYRCWWCVGCTSFADFADAHKLAQLVLGSHPSAFCISVMMLITNMVGEADSKEVSRRFRHWRKSPVDTL